MTATYLDVTGLLRVEVWLSVRNTIKASMLVNVSIPKLYKLLIVNIELGQNTVFTIVGKCHPHSPPLEAIADIFENLNPFMNLT